MNELRFRVIDIVVFITTFSILLLGCLQDSEITEKQSFANSQAEKLHKKGWALFNEGNFNQSIPFYYKAINIRDTLLTNSRYYIEKKLRDTIMEGIVRSHYNLGLSYYILGDYENTEKALDTCLNKLIEYEVKWGLQRNIRKARAIHQYGRLNLVTRGLEETLDKYQSALNYYIIEKETESVGDIYNDISALFVDWREPDSVIGYANKALKLYEVANVEVGKAMPHQNLGYAYILKEDFTRSVLHLDTAYYFFNKEENDYKRFSQIAKTFHNKALAFRLSHDFTSAHQNIDSAIHINTNLLNTPSSYLSLAKNYSNKADIYLDQGDLTNAKKYYERSIFQYGEQTKPQDFPAFVMPPPAKIIGDKIGFIEAVAGLAKTFAAGGDYGLAMETYREALGYFDAFRKDLRDKPSKIQLAHLTKQIFEAAISLSYKTKPEEAFAFAESSKSYTLLEAVRHYKAFDVAGIDSKLLKEENELRREIAYLAHQEINTDEVARKAELNEQRDALQGKLDDLLKSLESNERYQQLMSAAVTPKLSEIRESILDADQTLIEYFVGTDSTYIFSISPQQGLSVQSVPVSQEMVKERVTQLVASIVPDSQSGNGPVAKQTSAKGGSSPEEAYAKQASWFYENLLAPVIPKPTSAPQRLVIIPDDLLGYVPFDGLYSGFTKETFSYNQFRFIAEDYAISYAYSVSLLKEMQAQRKALATDGMLLYTYPENKFQKHRSKLNDIFTSQWDKNGQFIVEMAPEQPKESLHKLSEQYRYVHFSTHGEVNDIEPNLSFLEMKTASGEEQLLYLYEIYNIRLNAELVVTSACKTGIGRFFNGEGIMSLARGFSYAGARSIVTTLWAVQKAETEEILELFYQNLGKGMPKDLALYQAKKDYLIGHPADALNPYYWSGLIPIGNMNGLTL